MVVRAHFVFTGEEFFNPIKFDSQEETDGLEAAVRVNRQPSQPAIKTPFKNKSLF